MLEREEKEALDDPLIVLSSFATTSRGANKRLSPSSKNEERKKETGREKIREGREEAIRRRERLVGINLGRGCG